MNLKLNEKNFILLYKKFYIIIQYMDLTILPVSLLEILILFVYLLFLMNRYASKTVPLYVKLICVFSWMLSFSLIIVLPLEIYLTLYIKTLSDKEQK